MIRHLLASLVLGCTLTLAGGGCRSCQSCNDYDGPVADCNTCGSGRAGSASNCGAGSPCDGGCTNGCAPSSEYAEGPQVMGEAAVEYQQ